MNGNYPQCEKENLSETRMEQGKRTDLQFKYVNNAIGKYGKLPVV